MLFSFEGKLKRRASRLYYAVRHGGSLSREYLVPLPEGFSGREVRVRISVPRMPASGNFRFAEHAMDASGKPTRTVIATTTGGFAISDDLADTWRVLRVRGYEEHAFVSLFALGDPEYLAQVKPVALERNRSVPADLLILDKQGRVLDCKPAQSKRWHSCRAVGLADGVLMYAEYPRNRHGERAASRVFRSRDLGRSWEVVFEQSAEQVRHFHFLQPRPGAPGEWWLTSGDAPHQSRIWVSKDNGGTWREVSADSSLLIDGAQYPRSIFRLTDLFWNGPDVIWGTDDMLAALGPNAGGHVFRSPAGPNLSPEIVGRANCAVRNLVEAGDFLIVLTQASNLSGQPSAWSKPGVYLMPKEPAGHPALHHLFDIETYIGSVAAGKGFTYSRASRSAFQGAFFSYRAPYQALPLPNQILKWEVSFDG